MIPAVTCLALGIPRLCPRCGCGQIVQQHIEARLNSSLQRCRRLSNNAVWCFPMRSRQRYKRSFSATAKPVPSRSPMALWSNPCRCNGSLPGANQPAYHQQLQHLRPRHFLPSLPRRASETPPAPTAATVRTPAGSCQTPADAAVPSPATPPARHPAHRAAAPVLGNKLRLAARCSASSGHLQRLAPRRLLAIMISPKYSTRRCTTRPERSRRTPPRSNSGAPCRLSCACSHAGTWLAGMCQASPALKRGQVYTTSPRAQQP